MKQYPYSTSKLILQLYNESLLEHSYDIKWHCKMIRLPISCMYSVRIIKSYLSSHTSLELISIEKLALYGLKQAPAVWYMQIDWVLTRGIRKIQAERKNMTTMEVAGLTRNYFCWFYKFPISARKTNFIIYIYNDFVWTYKIKLHNELH